MLMTGLNKTLRDN